MKAKVTWSSLKNARRENQDNLSIGKQVAFPEGIDARHIRGQILMDIRENEVLFAVADGMGSCHGGKHAAAHCLDVLGESFYSFYSFYNTTTETETEEQTVLCEPLHTCTTGEPPLPVLRPVSQLLPLRAASLLEHEEEAESAPSRLMAAAMEARDALAETYRYVDGGCTLCAVAVSNGAVEWVSAGDSSIWLVHRGKLVLINPLDNRYYSHKALGLPANPKQKSILLNYVGAADAELHTGSFSFQHGDTLVLCTDGVDLEKALSRFLLKLNGSADQLCTIGNASDNATAIVISCI